MKSSFRRLILLVVIGIAIWVSGCSDKMDPAPVGPVYDSVVDTVDISKTDTFTVIDTMEVQTYITDSFTDTFGMEIWITDTFTVYNYDTSWVYEYDTSWIEVPPDTVTKIEYKTIYDTTYDTTTITITLPPDSLFFTDTLCPPSGWVIVCCGSGEGVKCHCDEGDPPRAIPDCWLDWYISEGWHEALPGDACLEAWRHKLCD